MKRADIVDMFIADTYPNIGDEFYREEVYDYCQADPDLAPIIYDLTAASQAIYAHRTATGMSFLTDRIWWGGMSVWVVTATPYAVDSMAPVRVLDRVMAELAVRVEGEFRDRMLPILERDAAARAAFAHKRPLLQALTQLIGRPLDLRTEAEKDAEAQAQALLVASRYGRQGLRTPTWADGSPLTGGRWDE